jgi:N-hydroxyarylamine O-acetyltransferase
VHPSARIPCSPEQLAAYLRRVGHDGPVRADAVTLSALHEAHLGAIPFENLEIHLGRPMRIAPDALFADLVERRRGGYCFQMNELFARVLLRIGFDVTRHAARVWLGNPTEVPARSHQCLAVIDRDGTRWLADVGFGGQSPLWPLRFGERTPVDHAGAGAFCMGVDRDHGYELRCVPAGETDERVLYTFTAEPQLPVDFVHANHAVSTMPGSHFVAGRLAARAERGLRQGLWNGRFSEVRNGVRSERSLDSAEEERVLQDVFGLDLPVPLVWKLP